MYECGSSLGDDPMPKCRFSDLGGCQDRISAYICNAHARLFGLYYKLECYTNGDNEVHSRIVAYCVSQTALSIPLFVTPFGDIINSQIDAWVLLVANQNPNVERKKLSQLISCMLTDNSSRPFFINSWLAAKENSYVIVRESASTTSLMPTLPPLHQMLFCYMMPSVMIVSEGNTQMCLVEHVTLFRDPTTGYYNFVLVNKKLVLKYTTMPGCVPTALCLAGVHTKSRASDRTTILLSQNNPFGAASLMMP